MARGRYGPLAIFVEGSVFEAHDSDEALAHLKSIVARRFGLTVDTFFPLSAIDTPRTTTGKIDRQNLARNILTENFKVYELSTKNGPQTSHAWPDGLTGRIARLWATTLKSKEVPDAEENFYTRGGDSLALAELFLGAESKFNVDIAPAEFLSCPTFGRFSTLVTSGFEGEESRPGLEDNLPAPSVASQHQALSKQWSYH
ncbi:MAG: phosphopantetheine-binding protein [Pseudoruegeria sp.]